jgi:2-keto-4-pentenoate hydratase
MALAAVRRVQIVAIAIEVIDARFQTINIFK